METGWGNHGVAAMQKEGRRCIHRWDGAAAMEYTNRVEMGMRLNEDGGDGGPVCGGA